MNRLFSLLMAAFLCCSLQNLSAESAAQAAELETKVAPQDVSLSDAERRELEEYVKLKAGVTLPCGLSASDLMNLKSCLTGIGPNCKKYVDVIVEKCCQGADDSSAGACVTNIANMVGQLPSIIPSSVVYEGFCQVACSSALCGSSPYIGHSCLYFCDPNGNMGSCFNAMSGSLTPEAVSFIKGAGLGSMPQYTAGSQDGRVPVLRGLCWPGGSQTCTGGKADCWTNPSACTAAGNGCNADFAKKCCTDTTVCKWDSEPAKK